MLSHVQRAHAGDYICRADNGVGRGAARETVTLDILREYLNTIILYNLHTIYTKSTQHNGVGRGRPGRLLASPGRTAWVSTHYLQYIYYMVPLFCEYLLNSCPMVRILWSPHFVPWPVTNLVTVAPCWPDSVIGGSNTLKIILTLLLLFAHLTLHYIISTM